MNCPHCTWKANGLPLEKQEFESDDTFIFRKNIGIKLFEAHVSGHHAEKDRMKILLNEHLTHGRCDIEGCCRLCCLLKDLNGVSS